MAEFGPVRLSKVPLSGINVLRQIRTHFDSEAIERLEASIKFKDQKDGIMRYDLIEPPSVALLNDAEAESYLGDLNEAWGTDYTLDDLVRCNPDGNGRDIMILIAGEQRGMAIRRKIENDGLSPDSLVMTSLEEGVGFLEAFPRQFIENNARTNPSPQDEAHAIRVYYDLMQDKVKTDNSEAVYTKAACARAFGIREEKVRDAVVFTDYPLSMQQMVDRYPYSTIVEAKEIFELYAEYYEGLDDGGPYYSADGSMHIGSAVDVAVYEVETCILRLKAERLRRRTNPNGARRDMSLKNQAEAIRASFKQEELGEFQVGLNGLDVPTDYLGRRLEANENLFSAALEAVALLDRLNGLNKSMKYRLGRYSTVTNVTVEPL